MPRRHQQPVTKWLRSLNARLPADKTLSHGDLQPHGPLVMYRADLIHSYILIRGNDPEHRNLVDMTVQV